MEITGQVTDEAILREMGGRLARLRLGRNLTQAGLATEAGVSKRTVERMESGEVATQLSGFLRVCRALGLIEKFDALVPGPVIGPMDQLKLRGKERRRASTRSMTSRVREKPWTWGDNQ